MPRVPAVRSKQPTPGSVQAVQELLRIVAATRESQEIERKRRLAWEQGQEAKFIQRQAETERQMLELRQEITKLRATANSNPPPSSGLLTPQYSNSPPLTVQRSSQLASPISPVSQPPAFTHPMFVQGSSNQPIQSHHQAPIHEPADDFQQRQSEQPVTFVEPPPSSVTPAPSPHTFVQESPHPASPANNRKRFSSELSSSDEESNGNNSENSASTRGRPVKRRSHHDKRCLTIQVGRLYITQSLF
jgi:hypothetical protein